MEETYVNKISNKKIALCVESKAGVSVIIKNIELGTLYTWINPEGISNILSIPILEKSGYRVNYETK